MIDLILCDSDGVLADMEGYYESLFGPKSETRSTNEFWRNVNSVEHYFYKLLKMKDADLLFSYLEEVEIIYNIPFKICTSTGTNNSKGVENQKRLWFIEKYQCFGDKVITVTSGQLKHEHIVGQTILIDDTPKVIDTFVRNGGIGILHKDAKSTIKELNMLLLKYKNPS